MYAHNGDNYDNHWILKSERFSFKSLINQGGLMTLNIMDDVIQFRDTMKMTGPRSLNKLCEDFKLPMQFRKTEYVCYP